MSEILSNDGAVKALKNWRIVLMLIAVGFIFGGATNGFGQTVVPPVGGFNTADKTDQEIVAATDFAVKKQAKTQKAAIKLVALNHAAKQIVAGTNYQMCLSVETTDRKTKTTAPQTVQAVVYRDLKGKYKLTSWAIAACTDAAPVAPVN